MIRKAFAFVTAVLTLVLIAAPAQAASISTPQKILGPTGIVDSLYITVRDSHGLHGIMSNTESYMFDQRKDGSLVNQRQMIPRGAAGSYDQCGVHPVGPIWKDPANANHWVTFYHAEKAAPEDNDHCNHDRTRWTIHRIVSWNGGRSWNKGPAVVTQDRNLLTNPDGSWSTQTDDAGSPHMVITGGYMYLIYRAVNETSGTSQQAAIARAPLSSLGTQGSWVKYFNGAWSEPGLGGQQSALPGLPASARGISYNTYLGHYLAVMVNGTGIRLYESDDLINWTFYSRLARFNGGASWGHTCSPTMPVAYGYGSIIGYSGSDTTSGQKFWVYYMKKPYGQCFDHRYLYRRLVTL